MSLENVHPFQREMWGIVWTFAHNGEVPMFTFKNAPNPNTPREGGCGAGLDGRIETCGSGISGGMPLLGRCREAVYHPVGDTDSEAVFCAMLNALRAEFTTLPTLPVLYEAIQRLCSEIIREKESETIFNFLLGCGQFTMFAFSWPGSRPGSTVWNGLHYLVRFPPFSKAELKDTDYAVDFNDTNGDNDRVAIIATKPLTTNEKWKEFKRGELLMFDYGLPYSRPYECAAIERCGRGLSSRAIPRGEICPLQYQYNIPSLLREAVSKILDTKESSSKEGTDGIWSERAVDLGCGSGLSGLIFRQHVRYLTGVEVSGEMAEEARERGCYNRIIVGDAECVLQHDHIADCSSDASIWYDFIFACDLVPYIGDLKPIFHTVQRSLECKGGTFAFSAEILQDGVDAPSDNVDEDGFVMQKCARFCHRERYIISLAEQFGFLILSTTEATVLRQHDGKDVLGSIFVLTLESNN